MRVYYTLEVDEAIAYAASGNQALHLHRIIVNRTKAPRCFVNAVDRGEPIAHLFDLNRVRLCAVARQLGVKVIYVDSDGTDHQHIDLVGGPLRKCYALLDADQTDKLKAVLKSLRPEVEDAQPSIPGCE